MSLQGLLGFVHVFANLVWIGSIVAVGVTLGSNAADSRARGALALAVYRRVAMPAFIVSFAAGAIRLGLDADFYFVRTKYMHGKLLFAVALIALHHVIGARAKRAAGGGELAGRTASLLTLGVLACAGIASFFAVLKPF